MAGIWDPVGNNPPLNVSTMLLLTDGSVLCQGVDGSGNGTSTWYRLVPQPGSASYRSSAQWVQVAPGPTAPLYYASAVLADGRVFVAGGEDNGAAQTVELLRADIYDPVANTWTQLPVPAGWTQIGDAPCCVLPNGKVLLGAINTTNTAIYDPVANTWTAAGAAGGKGRQQRRGNLDAAAGWDRSHGAVQ